MSVFLLKIGNRLCSDWLMTMFTFVFEVKLSYLAGVVKNVDGVTIIEARIIILGSTICEVVKTSLFVWLVGFLTSSSTTRLYRGRAPRQSVWQFYVLPHMRQSWETMTSVSAGHIILTPTQPVGSGRPQRESSLGPPHQESRALPTELPARKLE